MYKLINDFWSFEKMATNPYDFSFVLRKKLQRKIMQIFLFFLIIFALVNLILTFLIFPFQVGENAMNPEYPDKSLVFVAPCNFENPLFFQNYDIYRGAVVYVEPKYSQDISLSKKIINNFCSFFSLQKIVPFAITNKITEKPTLRRVVGLPGDTLYIKDYVVYIKPKGNEHFLTEFELTDRMYETIVHIDSSLNSTIGCAREMEEVVLGENQYFLLADNRVSSIDSRIYGAVDISALKGKAFLRFFPFSSFDSLL